jgi:ASCH domain
MAKQPDPTVLRCLAIRQPFAWAVCAGIKRVENRTISTPYRGRVAILASTSKTNVNEMMRDSTVGTLNADFFSFGAIIGVATLVAIVEMNRSFESDPDAVGPLCWIFEKAALIPEPIPSKGKLNLYSLTAAESEAVSRQLPGLPPQPSEPARAWEAAYRRMTSRTQSGRLARVRGR